jgi:hypothetical protein
LNFFESVSNHKRGNGSCDDEEKEIFFFDSSEVIFFGLIKNKISETILRHFVRTKTNEELFLLFFEIVLLLTRSATNIVTNKPLKNY